MSYFIFNGVNSKDLGIIVTKPIIRPTWAPGIEYQPIIGRPRQLPIEKTWYPNKELKIEAVLADTSPVKVRDVYDKLRGYGVLNISTDPHEFLNCYVDQIDPNGVALEMAEFPITFMVEPFAYNDTAQEIDIANANVTVEYNGTVFCDPQITIVPAAATATVNCNDVIITVTTPQEIIDASYSTDYSITLDCEGQLAYYTKPNGEKVACTQLTSGKFPRLHKGNNYVQAQTVQSATMTVRERWY